MADNGYPPETVAYKLEAIVTDLRELEGHLPAPLTLTTTQRELVSTAAVWRRLEDSSSPSVPSSNAIETDESQKNARTDPGDEPPDF